MQVPRDPKCLHWLWPCRICTYVIVLKRCECCVFILGESIVFVHCNLFAGIIVELKWQKHQRLKISVLVTHSALQMRVGFIFYVFITSSKKKNCGLKKTFTWISCVMWKSFPRMPFVWSLFLSEVHGAVEHDGLKNDQEVMALQTFDISHVNNLRRCILGDILRIFCLNLEQWSLEKSKQASHSPFGIPI